MPINNLSAPAITTSWNGSSFSNTQSITVAAGQNYLVVRFGNNGTAPTSITYAGQALTQLAWVADTNTRAAGVYYLANPASGNNDLVIDTGGSSRSYQTCISEISGVTAIGTPVTFGGWQGNSSEDITTGIGDIVIDVLSADQTATAGAGQNTDLTQTNNTAASSETATTTTTTMSWLHANDHVTHIVVAFTAGGVSDTISVTGDVQPGIQKAYSKTGFGSGDPNAGTITDGTASITLSSVNGTNFTPPAQGDQVATVLYGTGKTLELTNGTESAQTTISFVPPAGRDYQTLASISTDESRLTKDWTGTPEVGGQLDFPDTFDVNDAGEVVSAPAGSYTGYYISPSEGANTVFEAFPITIGAAVDITPDQFTFTDIGNQQLSTVVESNTITVAGVDAGEDVAVTITGGEYAVDSGGGFGAWTSAQTNVQLNYDIKVRHTTSGSYSTGTDTELTVGGISDTFTSTTISDPALVIDKLELIQELLQDAISDLSV